MLKVKFCTVIAAAFAGVPTAGLAGPDLDKLQRLLAVGMPRAAVAEMLGTADFERCNTMLVRKCEATWSTVYPQREITIIFVADRVVAWRGCQRNSIFQRGGCND